jgi:hypothetical protein
MPAFIAVQLDRDNVCNTPVRGDESIGDRIRESQERRRELLKAAGGGD